MPGSAVCGGVRLVIMFGWRNSMLKPLFVIVLVTLSVTICVFVAAVVALFMEVL